MTGLLTFRAGGFVDIAGSMPYILLDFLVARIMFGEQGYIVRLLRRVETSLAEDFRHAESEMLGKVIHQIVQSDDVHTALEHLYAVEGFDDIALRLMWLVERARPKENGVQELVLEHDAGVLRALFLSAVNGKPQAGRTVAQHVALVESEFYDVLHQFGRSVESLRNESHEGEVFTTIPDDRLFNVLDAAGKLREAAAGTAREDVVRFSSALSDFIHYVLDHERSDDVRVIHVLDNANLTLQTVLAAAGMEDFDSLRQTTDLLQYPRSLFE